LVGGLHALQEAVWEQKKTMLAGDVYKLLECTADAAFVLTPEGEICFWNAAAERLFGYAQADVLNRTCHEVLGGKSALGALVCAGEHSVQRCAARGEPIPRFDLEVTTRSGLTKWVSVSTIVFEDSRLHRRLIAHLTSDISKRKETEKAFLRMIELSKRVVSLGAGQAELAPVDALSDQERRIMSLFAKTKNSGQVANDLEAVLHAMKRGQI